MDLFYHPNLLRGNRRTIRGFNLGRMPYKPIHELLDYGDLKQNFLEIFNLKPKKKNKKKKDLISYPLLHIMVVGIKSSQLISLSSKLLLLFQTSNKFTHLNIHTHSCVQYLCVSMKINSYTLIFIYSYSIRIHITLGFFFLENACSE